MGVSACLIVKNEAAHIERCLNSLNGHVDELIILDTGSTDETVAIAGKYTDRIYRMEWEQDFSKARNQAMEHATQDWVLVIDADEELVVSDAAGGLKGLLAAARADAYSIIIENLYGTPEQITDRSWSHAIRLFRNKKQYRYEGRIHEQIVHSLQREGAVLMETSVVQLIHYGYMDEYKVEKNKFQRNTELLNRELTDHPDDPFHLLNLGQEYFIRSEYGEALKWYEKGRRLAPVDAPYYPRLIRNTAFCLMELGRAQDPKDVCMAG